MSAVQPAVAVAGSSTSSIMLPAALSAIAGVTDVTSWLLLGGFFSAHVTGNLVVIAADVVSGRTPGVAAVLAIPVFVLTTAGATLVARRLGGGLGGGRLTGRQNISRAGDTRTVTTLLLGVQALLLIVAAALSFTTRASVDPTRPIAVVIGLCAVCAMAAQNAYLHLVPAKAASTAVMTGNLVSATVAAVDLLLRRGDRSSARTRWMQSWPLLAGFVGGCLVGAAGATLFSDRAAVIPALLATILLGVVVLSGSSPRPTPRPTSRTTPRTTEAGTE